MTRPVAAMTVNQAADEIAPGTAGPAGFLDMECRKSHGLIFQTVNGSGNLAAKSDETT